MGALLHKNNTLSERRVLVLWADGKSPNLGVQVLGTGAAAIAHSVWGTQTHVNLQDFAGTQTGVPMGIKAVVKEFLSGKRRIRDFIKSHDYVFDTGAGDSFTDIYGLKRMLTIFIIQRWSIQLGVPVIMLPQTIGPFNSRIGKLLAKRQLRLINYVMARDPRSTEVSTQLGRVPEITSSDLVFALTPQVAVREFDVLFNVSGLLWHQNRHVDSESYREAVTSFARGMQERGRRVTLFAHVINGAPNDDDISAINDAASSGGLENFEVAIPASLNEAREMIAGANVVVGARMHACLNALSQGVPTIPWAYSRKFEPLLNDLGWAHFVDLREAEDAASETIKILDSIGSAELRLNAVEVAETGRAALSLTADGIRGYAE